MSEEKHLIDLPFDILYFIIVYIKGYDKKLQILNNIITDVYQYKDFITNIFKQIDIHYMHKIVCSI